MAHTTHHELEQQVREVEAAYLANDADRILSLFTDDARMLLPDVDVAGDALRQFIQDVCSRIDTLQFELRTHERWVHGTIAY
ncbi:nuclear transport factor 2 family protein, partial [bacterium]|nr:nuclear transport factor 2 family protein [bacterium]